MPEYKSEISFNFLKFSSRSIKETSYFFKKSLAHEALAKLANEIKAKNSRAEKDINFEYATWEFELDLAKLKEEAKKYNIESGYVDKILSQHGSKAKDGVLFFYYPSFFHFNLQWICANIILLLLYIFLQRVDKIWNKLKEYTPMAFWLALNGWIFADKLPEYMNIFSWIIPGLIALSVLVFMMNLKKG